MFEKLRSAQAPEEAPANGDEPTLQPSEQPVARLRPSLASLLADEGVASKEQLEHAAAEGLESGERLGEVVLRRGWITEAGLANLIARQWDLDFVARSLISVDDDAQARMSREAAHQLGVCPVTSNDGAPLVAIADPSEERFAGARNALGTECAFVITTPSALAQLIDELPESPHAPAVVSLAEPPVLSVAEAEPEADADADADETEAELETEHQPEAQSDVEPEVELDPDPEPTTFSTPIAVAASEPSDDGSPVLEQLDHLLDRLVTERVRKSDELAGYRRQLDDLVAEKTRLEESLRSIEHSIQSLESKISQEDELLASMRTRLADLR